MGCQVARVIHLAQPQRAAQPFHNGVRAAQGEVQIEFLASEAIRVPLDDEEAVRVLLDQEAQFHEAQACALGELVAAILKQQVGRHEDRRRAAAEAPTTAQQIIEQACEWLTDPLLVVSMQLTASPWGDGQAAQRIAEVLCREAQPAVQASRSHT